MDQVTGGRYQLSVLRTWSSGTWRFFERFVAMVELCQLKRITQEGVWSFAAPGRKRCAWSAGTVLQEECWQIQHPLLVHRERVLQKEL